MRQVRNLNLLSFTLILIFFLLVKSNFAYAQKENLNILDRWIEWSDGKNMLIHYLNKQAFDYLDIREQEIAKLKNETKRLNELLKKYQSDEPKPPSGIEVDIPDEEPTITTPVENEPEITPPPAVESAESAAGGDVAVGKEEEKPPIDTI